MNDSLSTVSEVNSCFEILAPPKPFIAWVDLTFEESDPSMTRDEDEVTSKRDTRSDGTCVVCV